MLDLIIGLCFFILTTVPVLVQYKIKSHVLKKKISLQEIILVYFLINFWIVFMYTMSGDFYEIPKLIPHFISVPSDFFLYFFKASFFSLIFFPFTLISDGNKDSLKRIRFIYHGNRGFFNNKPIYNSLLLFFSIFLFFVTYFIEKNFSETTADQVKFILSVNTNSIFLVSYLIRFSIFCIIIPVILFLITIHFYKNFFPAKICYWLKPNIEFNFNIKLFLLVHLLALIIHFLVHLGVSQYFDFNDTSFYEDNVVDPKNIKITFPENKRNLIVCVLESFESSFTGPEYGGLYSKNTIPELTKLVMDPNNIHFSHNDKIGGFYQTPGAQWTNGAHVALFSGLTMKMSLKFKDFYPFLPHIKTITDVLKENGYDEYVFLPHEKSFLNTDSIFISHGVTALGSTEIKENMHPKSFSKLDYPDYVLYNFTKMFLTNISKSGKPFNVMFCTIDTHMPHGFKCELCRNESKVQAEVVNYCADRQASDFVKWFQQQPFAHNTTLIIIGDHASMIPEFDEKVKKSKHHMFNLFVNSAKDAKNCTKNRIYHSFDFAPTILSSIGANIEGNRFWLGTDLFSGEKTLGEKYGVDKINFYLNKPSKFYYQKILKLSDNPQITITNFTAYEYQE